MESVNEPIDYDSLARSRDRAVQEIEFRLIRGQKISQIDFEQCLMELIAISGNTAIVKSQSADSSNSLTSTRVIGILLESKAKFQKDFLNSLQTVFSQTNTFVCYSDYLSDSVGEVNEVKVPAWSPIRFQSIDYVGPVLAFDLGSFNSQSETASLAITKDSVFEYAVNNKLRVSRIPESLYTCSPDFAILKNSVTNHQFQSRVSVVIPTKGVGEFPVSLISRCIKSISNQVNVESLELVVVADSGYSEIALNETRKLIPNSWDFKVIEFSENFNFSRKCNLGAESANGDVLLFLNDDVELVSNFAIARLSALALLEDVGAVGAQLHFKDGSIQHAGITLADAKPRNAFLDQFQRDLFNGDLQVVHEVSAVTGACLAIKKSSFVAAGGWNELLPNSYNDVDLCLNLNSKGFQSIICHDLEIVHNESSTRDSSFDEEAFRTLKLAWPLDLGCEKYLRSELALGRGYSGPWGIHKIERKDFKGRYFAYARDLLTNKGIMALVGAIWNRITSRSVRLMRVDSKRFL
jgi:GT2 family glycosyltransferase